MIDKNLRLVRHQWQLTQPEMAALFTITKGQYVSYESGRHRPSVEFMLHLEALTGISVRRLWLSALSINEVTTAPIQQPAEPVVEGAPPVGIWDALRALELRVHALEGDKGGI